MRPSKERPPAARLFGLVLLCALVAGGCTGDRTSDSSASPARATIPQPTQDQLEAAGLAELPLAPEGERVDIVAPTFSDPTSITNPLFPISDLHAVILSGTVDGKPFHTETTLLPETRVIEWSEGMFVEALVSQYVAYLDGRIEEVATDYYAQADDGSVWYLGEEVFDYDENGFVDATLGSWLAGREGPAQMIMPADPQVGDVHRAENIPAIAFEEVTVKTVGKTVDGPTGSVEGAIVESELHDDGTVSEKVFAPGYGEFFTAHEGDVEAMALAVPTDALDAPTPPQLEELVVGAMEVLDAAGSEEWGPAAGSRALLRSWDEYRQGQVPPRLAVEMRRALRTLAMGFDARDPMLTGTAAIDVAQSALDLELRYRPATEVDLGRFELWARQILVDAAAGDLGGVRSDIVTMEWIRDRFAQTLDVADLTRIDAHLVALRESTLEKDVVAAGGQAEALLDTLAGLQPEGG